MLLEKAAFFCYIESEEVLQMKKPVLLILPVAFLFVLTSCANPVHSESSSAVSSHAANSRAGSSSVGSSTATGGVGSGIPWNAVASDVCFRGGPAKDGPMVVSAKDIAGFNAEYSKENHTEQIVFQLTEQGKKSMSEATTRLSKSAGSMSLWAGQTKLQSASVFAPITDGNVAFTEPNSEQTKKDCVTLTLGHPEAVQSKK